jgi:hypothetical protein
MQHRASVIALAVVATAALATFAQAASSVDKVTGTYGYTSTSGPKTVSIDAHGTDPVKGTWSFRSTRANIRGVVTCLVVDGSDAWLAGTPTNGEFGAFFYLHDGGTPGTNDLAVTWIQDPGQPFEQLQGWCETQYTDVPLFEVESGNLVVRSGS